MNPEPEIRRLLDLMPASGRMYVKIVAKPQQSKVIVTTFPVPWNRDAKRIFINFDLWREIPKTQRDLLLLREVSWLLNVRWFKPELNQGVAVLGALGSLVEIAQGDALGTIAAAGLSAIAIRQIWRDSRSTQNQLLADEQAIQVAQRRGYSPVEAAENLLAGIETLAEVEGRNSLNYFELVRSQNLRALANRSPIGVPESVRQE